MAKKKKKTNRDTQKYLFKVGNKVVHRGQTKRPLEERESEHQNSDNVTETDDGKTYDWSKGHIVKEGNKVTKKSALKWERENCAGANQDC